MPQNDIDMMTLLEEARKVVEEKRGIASLISKTRDTVKPSCGPNEVRVSVNGTAANEVTPQSISNEASEAQLNEFGPSQVGFVRIKYY